MVYVGKTTRKLNERMREHRYKAKHQNKPICKAMREIGIENFFIELLEDQIPIEQLDEKEVYYIQKYDSIQNGYNYYEGSGYEMDEQEIVRLYQSGKTLKEIAKKYGVDRDVIKRRLDRNGIQTRDWNKMQRIEINPDDLRRMYEEELMTAKQIAAHYKTSDVTILKRLKKHEIPTRPANNVKR